MFIIKVRNFSVFQIRRYSYSLIKHIIDKKPDGDKVAVKGWVKAMRTMKGLIFADISDGSCFKRLQLVLSKDLKPAMLNTGASVEADGTVKITEKGQVELHVDKVSVIGECPISDGYPFVPRQSYSQEYIRQYLHLRPRTERFLATLRVRDAVERAIRDHLASENFICVHTPSLTSNDCEGAGEVYRVVPNNQTLINSMRTEGIPEDETFFNTKPLLTVSAQLHLEAAAHGLSRVYNLGPIWRAENSKSRLHLSEFYMLEAEQAFVNKLEILLETVEKLIKSVTSTIAEKCEDDISLVCQNKEHNFDSIDKPFAVLTYDEAIEILKNNQGKYKGGVTNGLSFTKEHEKFLVNYSKVPTFIINWPSDIKPFYMKRLATDNSKVAAFDLLMPNVGEIVGGSLREDKREDLTSRLPSGHRLEWYLDLRRYGSVPTGGFGMGFERYLQWLLCVTNIKDLILFPRWPHNCTA